MNFEKEKMLAAAEALKLVENGMIVGLGSGSTSACMIRMLGQKVAEGLRITGVPSSASSEKLAQASGIPLVSLDKLEQIDINIDGADEFDPYLQLIKGGGGAMLREKVLAFNSRQNIVITDSQKQVQRLGQFRLPVEVIPFATQRIRSLLDSRGLKPVHRVWGDDFYRTDEGNYILDLDISSRTDLSELEHELLYIPGVVETGLFLTTTTLVLMGKGNEIIRFHR